MNIVQKHDSILFDKNNGIVCLDDQLSKDNIIRFAITKINEESAEIDYAVIEGITTNINSIFDFDKRNFVDNTSFNAVMIIPTGIGAEIGGDSGDGNVAARLIAGAVDTLITHPNVVNGAEINEMTDNTMYVEGSVINRLICGKIGLMKSNGNRMLLIHDSLDDRILAGAVNAASASRVTLGADIDVIHMTDAPVYSAFFNDKGMAVGHIKNIDKLIKVIEDNKNEYDSFVLHTVIAESKDVAAEYFAGNIQVNPWGGIEAMITHTVSTLLNVRTAHAPAEPMEMYYPILDPAKTPETLSKTELHCVLKGMRLSPQIVGHNVVNALTVKNIHALITPDKCIGIPLLAAMEQGIPVIAVDDKENIMENDLSLLPWKHGKFYRAKNYAEAAGILLALKNGIDVHTMERPITPTNLNKI